MTEDNKPMSPDDALETSGVYMTAEELYNRYISPTLTKEQAALQTSMVQFKLALISPALFKTHLERSDAAYFRQIAAASRIFPDGRARKISVKTLERWKREYLKMDSITGKNGMDALIKKTRSDKGKSRKLRLEVMMEICRILDKVPNIKCTVIKHRLEEKNQMAVDEVSADTIRRFILAYDLRDKAICEMRIRRSFVYEKFGQLWEADTCYLTKIPSKDSTQKGELDWVYIQGIIDDHSRKLVALCCYLEDSAHNYIETLRSAVSKYGIPTMLYLDNGGPYVASVSENACNKMGIRIIHTRANDGASKAVIERAWFSLQIEVIPHIILDELSTLEEIQEAVDSFKRMYNARINSGVNGIPNERYEASVKLHGIRRPKSEEWLTDCFMEEEYCHVYNDNTIQKDCKRYEIPDEIVHKIKKGRGKTLQIHYYPGKLDTTICTVFNGKKYPLKIEDREKNAHKKRNTGGRKAQLLEQQKAKEQRQMSKAEARAEERLIKHLGGVDLNKLYSVDTSDTSEQVKSDAASSIENDLPVSAASDDSRKNEDNTEAAALTTDMSALFE